MTRLGVVRLIAEIGAVLVVTAALAACSPSPSPATQDTTPAPTQVTTPSAVLDSRWAVVAAHYPDAVRPHVAVVQVISDKQDWAKAITDCITGKGYTGVTATPDGAVSTGPSLDNEQGQIDLYACFAAYPQA